jgi:hypothetical protein
MQVASGWARTRQGDCKMGKYLIAWLLGVPGIVLVLIWLIFD